jgi:AcrR family transcriptional regulator
MEALCNSMLKSSAFRLLALLAQLAEQQRVVQSQEALATMLKVVPKTIQRGLQELEEAGYIRVSRQGAGQASMIRLRWSAAPGVEDALTKRIDHMVLQLGALRWRANEPLPGPTGWRGVGVGWDCPLTEDPARARVFKRVAKLIAKEGRGGLTRERVLSPPEISEETLEALGVGDVDALLEETLHTHLDLFDDAFGVVPTGDIFEDFVGLVERYWMIWRANPDAALFLIEVCKDARLREVVIQRQINSFAPLLRMYRAHHHALELPPGLDDIELEDVLSAALLGPVMGKVIWSVHDIAEADFDARGFVRRFLDGFAKRAEGVLGLS